MNKKLTLKILKECKSKCISTEEIEEINKAISFVNMSKIKTTLDSVIVEKLQNHKKEKCNLCGDVNKPSFQDCGCVADGFNKGIEKAISVFIEHYYTN